MNYPTDLSVAEQLRARARLADLAEQFTVKQILRTPVWREVFERTWRHPYVPGYYPDKDSPPVLCIDGPRRGEWLDAVVPHWAGFMAMRRDVEPADLRWPVLALPATQSWTTIDPVTLNTHGLFGFIVQWQLPDVTHGRMDRRRPARRLPPRP